MSDPQTTRAFDTPVHIDQIVFAFEKAFRAGDKPRIEDYLTGSESERSSLLIDLVHSELELRLRVGQDARLSEYLHRFPELAGQPTALRSILETELRSRTQRGELPALREYEETYTLLGGQVREAFDSLGLSLPELPGYRLTEVVGQGGMGTVYRARHLALDRDVAIKTLKHRSGNARRFEVEARITGQLQHPGIPPVHDYGTLPDGRPFLVMKLIRGQTLAALLANPARQRRGDAGPITDAPGSPNLVAVFEQICQAVGYAHAHRVVHRDLKPSNVMVGAFGEVQVMDWGLAKLLPDRPPSHPPDDGTEQITQTEIQTPPTEGQLTAAGLQLGTPNYMPPEQANGHVQQTDCRSDVFALGGVLCTILTGQPTYTTEAQKKAQLGLTDEAFARLDACGADPELVAIAKRCLARNPDDRPADANDVARLVNQYRAGVEARLHTAERERAAAIVEVREQAKRRKVLTLAAAAVVLAMAAAAGVSLWQAGIARAEAANARKAEGDAQTEAANARTAEGNALAARDAEQVERESADEIVEFMRSVFRFGASSGQPGKENFREPTVKQALDEAVKQIESKFEKRPLVEAKVRKAIADAYVGLRAFDSAIPQLRRRLAIHREKLGDEHDTTWVDMNNLGQVLMQQGAKYHDEAEELLTLALAKKRAKLGTDNLSTIKGMNNLAGLNRRRANDDMKAAVPLNAGTVIWLARMWGHYATAERLQREAYEASRRLFADNLDHDEVLKTTTGLGALCMLGGRPVEAEPFFRTAAEGYERTIGAKFNTAQCWSNVGDSLLAQQRYSEAAAVYERALAILRGIDPQEGAALRKQIEARLNTIRNTDPSPREK